MYTEEAQEIDDDEEDNEFETESEAARAMASKLFIS